MDERSGFCYLYAMNNEKSYPLLLKDLINEMSLFESAGEVDEILTKALGLLMEKDGAHLGSAYVYDVKRDDLVFRVGYDKGDLWDRCRCGDKKAPRRFTLDDSHMGKAFSENTIKVISRNNSSGDYSYGTKILVPITRGPEKLGVLILAYKDENAQERVNLNELKEAVALLGDMLSEASMLIDHINLSQGELLPIAQVIRGKKTSHGIAQGRAFPLWSDHKKPGMGEEETCGTVDEEKALFERALVLSQNQLTSLTEKVSAEDREIASMIFTAQLLMLKDNSLTDKMIDLIETGKSAAESIHSVIEEYARIFSQMTEVRLSEKAQDVRDLGYRLSSNLNGEDDNSFSYSGKIVLSRHIYPSDLYRLSLDGAAGIVLRGATVTSHISILAQSLDIPVLTTDDKSLLSIEEGTPLVLDVDGGKLYVNPEDITRRAILDNRKKQTIRKSYTIKGQTKDGVMVKVMANVNISKDAHEAVRQGAEGIGLYRSEFPFILKNDFLSEEQQYRIYRSIAVSQKGKPLVFRTADIGGDKLLQGRSEEESNPFLGVRGIRFSLANKEFFHDQLKAMLRAGAGEDLHILLPMVTDWEEIVRAKEEINHCLGQLRENRVPHNDKPLIGAMIELPSAAISVEEIIEETDFISIGTNDLTMYLLAVDRTNDKLTHLYRSHHPVVLKVLSSIISKACERNTDLSVCGDVASDPLMIPFLVGLGVRKLSVSPQSIEEVKEILQKKTLDEMKKTAQEMLSINKLSHMENYRKEKVN
jgi:phosphotransferase system enzyme I (PtsP)